MEAWGNYVDGVTGKVVPLNAHAERSEHPHFVRAAPIVGLDPVPVQGPPRSRGERTRAHRAELVGAADRTRGRRLGVERDDCRPFGTNSGSLRPVPWGASLDENILPFDVSQVAEPLPEGDGEFIGPPR